jgi:hypothetical protein
MAHGHGAIHMAQPVRLLADCVLRTSEGYFTPGRTVVISSAFTKENCKHQNTEIMVSIEDTVIEGLNLIGLWPIAVYRLHRSMEDMTKYNPYVWEHKNDDRHSSYILILRCHEGGWIGALDSMRKLIMQLKTSAAWNSRGKFTVVFCHCVSNDVREDLKIFLEHLWLFKVFHVILLYPSARGTVDIYTWFPFQFPSARCGEILNVVHLDTWVQEQNKGLFQRNVTLFTKSITRDLQGCIFRASTIKFHPYVIFDKNATVEGGIDVQVLRTVAKKLNASLEFRVIWGKERKGQRLSNGTWTGLKGDLIYDKADIAIGSFLSNFDDHVVFDDTNTYHTGRFTWIVARARPYPRWLSMGRVFTPTAWLVVLTCVFLVGLVMKYVSNSLHSESGSEWDTAKCILSAWAAFLEAGVPEMPRNNTLRVLFLSWIVYSLAMNTVFQAFFTSFEVDPGLQHQIDTTEELLNTPTVYAFSSPLDRFFTTDMLKRLTPRIRCEPTKCVEHVATVFNATTFAARVLLGYHHAELVKEKNRHDVHPFREDSFQLHSVMLVQKGSPFLLQVNEIIRRIVEAGLSDYWKEAILEQRRVEAGILALESLKDTYVEMSLSHLEGAFIFLLIGTGLSFTAFITEVFFKMLSTKFRRNNSINFISNN